MPLSQIVSASIEDGAVTPVDLSSVAQYTGFKNRLINGGMGIWQRGTTTSTNVAYIADRWFVYSNSGTITGSRSTDVPANFQYSFSASGTGYPQVTQRIESVNCLDLSGQTITVSFWAKQTSGAGAGSIGVQLTYAGSSDNWTAPVVIGTNPTFTGTTGWVQYSATYTNLPSNVLNGLAVTVYGNTVGSATVLFTGVQLEKGVTATSFDYRPYGTELSLCQRYCYVWYPAGGVNEPLPSTNLATTISYATITFPVTLRASASSITVTNPTSICVVGPTGTQYQATSIVYALSGAGSASIYATIGSAVLTAGYANIMFNNSVTLPRIVFNGAEL